MANPIRIPSSEPEIITEEINGKGLLILNRPKVLNAANYEMTLNVWTTLNNWSRNKSIIIIKGNGDKAFCAGGDLRSVVLLSPKRRREFFKIHFKMSSLIGSLTIPCVALIDGITMGGRLYINFCNENFLMSIKL